MTESALGMARHRSDGPPIVEAIGLVKTFGDFWLRAKARAVDGIAFEVRPHEIFGLLGPNGSGKSTTIKMILGLLRPTKGRLLVFGRDPGDVALKSRIGYLPEESYLYRYLTPRETLDYYAKLFGMPRAMRRKRTDELLEMVGLEGAAHRVAGEFSKGMARRLGLAQALINDPDFLILDEPTSGLDPIGTRQVKDLLLDLGRRGKTILLSSHLLADVEDVCDRMVVLYGGKIRASGTTEELLTDTNRTTIRAPRLKSETITKIDQLIAREEGVAIEAVDAPRQRLEDLFVQIVERARQEQSANSGALHGGRTAAFLVGGPDASAAATPSTVIEELERAAPAKAPTPPRHEVARTPAAPSVVDELVRPKESPVARAPHGHSPAPDKKGGPDASVIDGLLEKDSKGSERGS